MRRCIRKVISDCELCQRAKISKHLVGEMHSVVPNNINEVVCVDLMGPLPKGRRGATFLLVFVDAFSKLVTLFAIKRATAKHIIRCLEQYISKVGKINKILSDNGS